MPDNIAAAQAAFVPLPTTREVRRAQPRLDTMRQIIERGVENAAVGGTINVTVERGAFDPSAIPQRQLRLTPRDANPDRDVNERMMHKLRHIPDVPIRKGTIKRAVSQPIFKLDFDNPQDADLRLRGTLIFIGPDLYHVSGVYPSGEGQNEIVLIVEDATGRGYKIPYTSDDINLRTPEPQYINSNAGPVWMFRSPHRQQRQGLTTQNTFTMLVGKEQKQNIHPYEIIRGFQNLENLSWDQSFEKLLLSARAVRALRLSPRVAIYRDDDHQRLVVEYKGRKLGEVSDEYVSVHPADVKPWIVDDVRETGFRIKEKKDA